ncbi:MAG: type IX secretion system membrane protein PorP/SprF [Bacteroidota bacterium]
MQKRNRDIAYRCGLLLLLGLAPMLCRAQSDQHYTMFMYNKLLYNPAYTGSRDVLSVNGLYRKQWTDMPGAPQTVNLSVDAPLGSYMKTFRKLAAGISITNEKQGVERNSSLRGYYAYRLQLKHSVLSLGLSAGANLYSANYTLLNPYQQNDPNLNGDVKNAILPNFGVGAYWSGDKFYCGLSAPNLLENRYDKNAPQTNVKNAKQIRSYYLSGGYVFTVNEIIKLEPQVLARYAVNPDYRLPFNCDINITAIAYDRLMLGVTYRTDKSMEMIAHMQATKRINLGYAFDYMLSALNGYSGATHELVLGYDLVRETTKFHTPRFIKSF